MANKFYAVKVGRTTGIFNNWEECKKQVDGYPSPVFKSFPTAAEAMQFLGWGSSSNTTSSASQTHDSIINSSNNSAVADNNTAVAYVDGSYNITTGEFGYGVVFFYKGEETNLFEGFCDESLSTMRNVAGEIKGSEAAMKYAVEHDIKSLHIYHDYEGIAKWCTGEWKTNKDGTKAYKAFYESVKHLVDIKFIKVKGHSGDKYNDAADLLAKKACGVL
jgi:ribonuclease HI